MADEKMTNDGNPTNDGCIDESSSRNIYEEERKALLIGMATKLQTVVKRMKELNKDLNTLSHDTHSISNLSNLWEQSYLMTTKRIRDVSNDDTNKPNAGS